MNILYDDQIFTTQRFGGISRYFVELMRNLPEGFASGTALCLSRNEYIREVMPVGRPWPVPFGREIMRALNRRKSRRLISAGDFDVFHPTYYNPYFLDRIGSRPYVVTVHDMIHERFPESFASDDPTATHKRRLVEGASGVIAISESTKRDLVELYGLDSGSVDVVYHGTPAIAAASVPVGGLPRRYVLFVGDRNKYKNFGRFARAFARVRRSSPDVGLVCTGRKFSSGERAMLSSLGLDDAVTQLFAGDGQMRWLYANAACFVFPSLYEGFGFPMLEAFLCGAPVAASASSSLPEVGGDAAVYFRPDDEREMADVICSILDDSALADGLRSRGRERAADFSWQNTARQTAAVYARALTFRAAGR